MDNKRATVIYKVYNTNFIIQSSFYKIILLPFNTKVPTNTKCIPPKKTSISALSNSTLMSLPPMDFFHMSQTLWSPSNRFIKALTQNIQLPNYSRSF